MRIFIGIKCSEEIQNYFSKWQEKNKDLPVRFIEYSNFHLTLVPPFWEENVKKIIERFNEFNFGEDFFDLSFDEIKYYPLERPRMIWASGKTPDSLLRLKDDINKHFENLPSLPPSLKLLRTRKLRKDRGYSLHITLARFKQTHISKLPKIRKTKINLRINVDKITLFESRLTRLGAAYRIITQKSLRS